MSAAVKRLHFSIVSSSQGVNWETALFSLTDLTETAPARAKNTVVVCAFRSTSVGARPL